MLLINDQAFLVCAGMGNNSYQSNYYANYVEFLIVSREKEFKVVYNIFSAKCNSDVVNFLF